MTTYSTYLSATLIAAVAAFSAACVDRTSSTGERGLLEYSLYTDYDVDEGELTDARIVTGHVQRIDVRMTAQGVREITTPDLLQHFALTAEGGVAEGVTIEQRPGAENEPADFTVLVAAPGTYTIESRISGDVIDAIALTFAQPTGFELLAQVRAPWTEEFRPATGDPVVVEEGSQVAFQPVPVDENGNRLAGELTTSMSVDPEWAVVPGVGVVETYENGVWTVGGEANFYFIEPATVTFTVLDPVTAANGLMDFDVTPVVVAP